MDDALKKSIIDLLQEEQEQLNGALDNQSSTLAPETMEKVSIYQNEDGTWTKDVVQEKTEFVDGGVDQANRSGVKKKAEKLQEFTRAIDQRILSFNAEINVKKDQIVTLSTEATNGNCWPGIAYSSTQVSSVRSAGTGTTTFVEGISVNNEIESIKIYPKMAGPGADNNTDNPFEPDTVYVLTNPYTGYGYENLRDPNYRLNNDGSATGSSVDGSGSAVGSGRFDISSTLADHNGPRLVSTVGVNTGYWYAGAGVAPDASDTSVTAARCVAIASSISDLYDEILELRKKRDTLRPDLNTLKDNKMEKELAAWGMNRMENEVNIRQTKNSAAIAAVSSFDTGGTITTNELIINLDAGHEDSYIGIGTEWTDLSGNGYDATLFPTGSPATYEYSDGSFLTFNGTDEYAETITKSTDVLGTGGEWTMEAWFRVNGAPSNTAVSNVIVDVNPTAASATLLNVTYGTAGGFAGVSTNRFTYSSRPTVSDSYTHLQGPEITNDLWYHGAVVRNGDTNTKLYLNGSLVNTHEGNLPANSEGFARIARWTDGTSFANISVSLVKIYQKSHTDSEIKSKFDANKGRFTLLGPIP